MSELFINWKVNGQMKGRFICCLGRRITIATGIDFLPPFLLGWDVVQGTAVARGALSDLRYHPRLSAAINLAYYLTLVISTRHIKPY